MYSDMEYCTVSFNFIEKKTYKTKVATAKKSMHGETILLVFAVKQHYYGFLLLIALT